jgi:hypothetical protein
MSVQPPSTRPSARPHPGRILAGGALAAVLGLALAVRGGAPSQTGASVPAAPQAGPVDPRQTPYQLGVAREGNVVVVIESTGWAKDTERALELALQRAIPGAEGRCGEQVLPCPKPAPTDAGSGPFALTAEPTLTDADWARITRGRDQIVNTDEAASGLGTCVSVLPDEIATEAHSRTYEQSTQPAAVLDEYVLRYFDAFRAAGAVARLRQQLEDCAGERAEGRISVQLHEHLRSDGTTWWLVDEVLIGDLFPTRADDAEPAAELGSGR